MDPRRSRDLPDSSESTHSPLFPEEVLERILSMLQSHKDRNSASLVSKSWYNAERWARKCLFIGNCYSVSPAIVARRFLNIRSVTLKGRPRFSDFNMVPQNWGGHVYPWLLMFVDCYPSLEELRLKRMTVTDEGLKLLSLKFLNFKALTLCSCDGFSTHGLASIATHCRNLTELDIQENDLDEFSGNWLSCFPENFTSLEVLNFASLNNEVDFDALERLVSKCHKLKTLKVNRSVTLNQLQRLLICAPGLTELGTGSFLHELTAHEYAELERAFSCCQNLLSLSGLTEATSQYLPVLYPVCAKLTFLNLSYAMLQSEDFSKLIVHCSLLQRLWVLDTIGDKGLEAVGENCPFLEELRVFPADPDPDVIHGPTVTEAGFLAVSYGCRRLHYVLYFCHEMTNAAVSTIVRNCPDFTHFRLCIMNPGQADYKTNEPMDEAFGAVVKTCSKLRRLGVSGLLTDLAFEHIGRYAKNLETLSVAFAGDSDWAMECVLRGCPKLRKLEIRDSPFGNAALLSGTAKYESMRSLWMSACKVTINGCEKLAREMPRLNVEVMTDDESGNDQASKVYIYRSVAGPRGDGPSFVLTLETALGSCICSSALSCPMSQGIFMFNIQILSLGLKFAGTKWTRRWLLLRKYAARYLGEVMIPSKNFQRNISLLSRRRVHNRIAMSVGKFDAAMELNLKGYLILNSFEEITNSPGCLGEQT